ncbi:MAG TPA: flagellar motor protein MotB [Solirubrobacteraceae bacterium]|nr:flagellar motor protein MotB [Solirubrobacteraceae bacterium]
MAHGRGRGRHRGGHQEEGGAERWLLTYADMITLLMALFMVLFSISSVNISKYQEIQHSLRAAFSGNILPGGKSIAKQGSTNNSSQAPSTQDAAAVVPLTAIGSRVEHSSATHVAQGATASSLQSAAQQEASVFAHIKQQIEAYARAHGFSKSVQATIEARGLVIRLLTDDLLFASGKADLEGRSNALLAEISALLNVDETHPIDVEGNTDSIPIHGGLYPSNWELSTARASTVVRFLSEHGVSAHRMTATGYAEQHPLASNASAAGRTRNRRVEIVMKRIYGSGSEP